MSHRNIRILCVKRKTHLSAGADISYRTPKKLGACVVQKDSEFKYHQHCHCSSDKWLIRDFNDCKLYCDTDINCKGFTQTTNERTACQLATTSICPPGCTKRNQCDEDSETCDTIGPLVLDAEWGSDSPTGCYIKTTGN